MAEILIVDDSKVMRVMIIACLQPLPGVGFTQAANVLEGIEKLSAQKFDLCVLDLDMPDLGGLEVLEFARAQDRLREVPIIVVTTRGDENSRAKAMAAGATAFMSKPFDPKAILAAISGLLAGLPRAA